MIELNKGLRVTGTDLWLDSTRIRPFGFISHAHGDHTARHKKVIASPATCDLCRVRLGSRSETMPIDFGKPVNFGAFSVELFPAGHILGAAQIMIQNGKRIVYTGDFRLRESRTAGSAEIKECDVLIIECTFGKPRYRFPDRSIVEEQIIDFIETAFEDRKIPVLYAYALGKSQEILKFLGDRGYTVCLPKKTLEIVGVYESNGVSFKNYERLSTGNLYGKVVLLPPYLARTRLVKRIGNKRTAVLTGWALDPGAAQRYGAEKAFAFSDHADFDELNEYVRRANPDKIFTAHGSPELAGHLRKQGWNAEHLSPGTQLGLW